MTEKTITFKASVYDSVGISACSDGACGGGGGSFVVTPHSYDLQSI